MARDRPVPAKIPTMLPIGAERKHLEQKNVDHVLFLCAQSPHDPDLARPFIGNGGKDGPDQKERKRRGKDQRKIEDLADVAQGRDKTLVRRPCA